MALPAVPVYHLRRLRALHLANDLIGIIEALPRAHRKFLIEKHRPQFSDKTRIKNEADGIQRLISLLKTPGVAPYRHLYMRRSSRFFVWYEPQQELTIKAISDPIKARPNWRTGFRPVLKAGEKPKLHRLFEEPDGILRLDFVSEAGQRAVQAGYDFEVRPYIQHDIIFVRDNPTTIEIAARSATHRADLLESFAAVVSRKPENFTLRAVDTVARRESLASELKATVEGEAGSGRAKNLVSYSFRSKRGTGLANQEDFKKVKAPHMEARVLEYDCTVTHADGYPEVVRFYINTENGYIKFDSETSEVAVGVIRDEILKIAR